MGYTAPCLTLVRMEVPVPTAVALKELVVAALVLVTHVWRVGIDDFSENSHEKRVKFVGCLNFISPSVPRSLRKMWN